MSKLSYKTLFIIFFFLLIGIVILWKFILPNNKISAAWWNDSWMYRKAINITNSSGSNLTDFQVSLSIGTSSLIAAGKMQSDCDDIRITDQNGQLLSYWIEENNPGCNQTTDTKIWIKTPSLPTSNSIIYIYYGNTSADNAENGDQVFELFDDFKKTTLDSSKWTSVIKGVGGSYGITNGQVILTPNPSTVSSVNLLSTATFTNNIAIEIRRKQLTNSNYMEISLGAGTSVVDEISGTSSWWHTTLNKGYYWFFQNSGQTTNGIYLMNSGSKLTIGTSGYILDTSNFVVQKMTLDAGGTLTQSNNSTVVLSGTNPTFVNSAKNILISQGEYTSGAGDAQYIDYIFVHKLTTIDPILTLQSEELSPAPIAYWKFDEGIGTTIYDSTSNQNNGILGTSNSAPTWQTEDQCISGKCLNFDGTNDKVNLNSMTTNLSNSFTFSAWLKVNTNNGNVANALVSEVASYNNYWAAIGTYQNKWNFVLYDGSHNPIAFSTDNFELNTWTHITGVRDTVTDKIFIYKNGVLQGSGTIDSTTSVPSYSALNIGGQLNVANRFFPGQIDEVKIYPYARTATQIKQDYNTGKAHASSSKGTSVNLGSNKNNGDLSNGLVGYWKMEENIGTSTIDSSGNNNTGIFGTGDSAPSWSNGKYGIGLSFTPGSYLSVNSSTLNNATVWSINTQVKYINQSKQNEFFIGKNNDISTGKILFRHGGYVSFYGNNQIYYDFSTLSSEIQDTSKNISFVSDGTKVSLYVDGIFKSSVTPASTSLSVNTIANAWGDTVWTTTCLIDELRVYNRTLNQTEITQLYNYAPPPVVEWKMDEKTGIIINDNSGAGNTGSLGIGNSAPTWTQGKIGSALSFDGVNDYVSANTLSIFNGTNKISNFAWVYITGTPSDSTISSNQYLFYMQLNSSNKIRAYLYGTSSPGYHLSNSSISSNSWHYIGYTYDGSNINFYIDGKLDITIPNTGNITFGGGSARKYLVGGEVSDGFSYRFFPGKIDQIRIYNYIRTQKQIIEDMNAGHPITNSPLIYYKFDEGFGSTAYNSGIGGSTLNGTLGSGLSAPSWTTNGKSNKALSFNGTGTYVRIPALSGISQTTWTAWVKPNNTNTMFVLKSAAADYMNINVYNYSFRIRTFSGSGDIFSSLGLLPTDKWSHLAMVYTNPGIKLYLNGNLTNQSVGYSLANLNGLYYIGSFLNGSDDFNGLIDEVKIYNTALTDDEIKIDYNQSSATTFSNSNQTIGSTITSLEFCVIGDTSPCYSPVAEWKMDEKTGIIINDNSGAGNTGSLGIGNSAPTWTQGKIGSALSFDGSNDYITVAPPGSTNATISGWIYPDGTQNTNARFFNIGNGGLDIAIGESTRTIKYYTVASGWVSTSTTLPSNQWSHLTVTSIGTSFSLYVNGAYKSSYGYTNSIRPTKLGANSNAGDFFKGKMDQIRLYNYVRTSAQIAWDYNRGAPVSWWKFDECQGNITYDWSGIGNTGVISIGASGSQTSLGTCQVGTSSAWTNGVIGKYNSSLNFDSIDDYIQLSSTNIDNIGTYTDFSVSSWNYQPSFSSYKAIICQYFGTHTYCRWQLGTNDSKGFVSLYGGSSSPSYKQITGNITLEPNKWNHLTAVYSRTANLISLYVNGIFDKSINWDGYIEGVENNKFNIGRNGGTSSQYMNGKIDDVRLYNYALTNEQVKQIYNGGSVSFN